MKYSMSTRDFPEGSGNKYCIRFKTRGGIYGKIWPEPEGFPKGEDWVKTVVIVMIEYLWQNCQEIAHSQSPNDGILYPY